MGRPWVEQLNEHERTLVAAFFEKPFGWHAFLTAIVANWISAGVRLIPLGHTDSQRLLQMLEPVVGGTAQRALVSGLDDLGSATFRADIAGIKHETQYTRLFRS